MADSPLVSIVTPVYNGEPHLAECIESVLNQSYDNWEYVVLDNASTDRTAEIIEGYAARDGRIRCERNDRTLPIMENWNTALSHISPESRFCKVVHADDQLLPDCIGRMVAAGVCNPSASIIAAYRIDGREINMAVLPYPEGFISGRELCRRRLLGLIQDPFGSPTSVMYRAADVRARESFYNPANPHADTEVCFDLLREGDYAFVHQVLTFTRRHEGAETSQARRMGTHGAARLMIARDYGGDFLDRAGRERAVQLQLGYQYGFIAANLGRFLRDREFRHYHRNVLEECGAPLQLGRLSFATLKVMVRKLEQGLMTLVRGGERARS